MNATIVPVRITAGCLAATLLAACASSSSSPASVGAAPSAVSSPVVAYNKLTKGLTGSQIQALLGAPTATKPLTAGGVNGQIWSYPFASASNARLVEVATQGVPAVNPITGQSFMRPEPVFQSQTVETTDTLHLLMVDDRLVEWRVVRKENNQVY